VDSPLRPAVTLWLEKVKKAWEKKAARFGVNADEGVRFFAGPYGFMYEKEGGGKEFYVNPDSDTAVRPAKPTFCMTVNKVAELVQIFGPALYARNPNRQVNPRRQATIDTDVLQLIFNAFPQYQQMLQQLQMGSLQLGAEDSIRSILLESYLNATPNLLDLKTQSRHAIDEALIKGMGCLWPMVYRPPGSDRNVVGSFFDSVDNLLIDPDATSLYNAKWIARRRCRPKWEVLRERPGIDPNELKGHFETSAATASVDAQNFDGYMARAQGKTADAVIYWEVYSKCGIGNRLNYVASGGTKPIDDIGNALPDDFVYLEVCQDYHAPLNCPPAMTENVRTEQDIEQIKKQFQWPTPFWADGLWPFAPIVFHTIPNDPWPMSHIAPAMGELKFLNWFYSHLAGKVLVTSRDFLAIDKGASQAIREALRSGGDLTILELQSSLGKSMADLVSFVQHPPMNKDIFTVGQLIEHNFEQRTGLTELKYGISSQQLRSATEAEIKKDQADVRPEEMQNQVEDAMGMLARQEAFAARWHLAPMDVQGVLGAPASFLWQQFVTPSDPRSVMYDLVYRIEAGSVRKPNRSRDAENWTAAMQNLMPFFQQLASMGLVGPYNALIKEWAKSKDMDPTGLMLPIPPPPQAGQPGQAARAAA
jgi:hypothetical protein